MRTTPLVLAFSLFACAPPSDPVEPAGPPVTPTDEGGIPWAPGEKPGSAEETTREASPEPVQEERPQEFYEEDGVEGTSSGPACTGKATPALRAAIQARASETGTCREHFPEAKAGAKGQLKYNVRVARSGNVERLELLVDTLKVDEVRVCIEDVLKKPFSDAPPTGGCAMFVIPIEMDSKLEPVAGEDGAAPSDGAAE